MNKELSEIIKLYSTKPHKDFSIALADYSKETIIALFTDLLTMYINDKNSSTIREFITVTIAGYEHQKAKIGFNGFKHNSIGKMIGCEAKPKNILTEDLKNKEKKSKRFLDGGGNITDYTIKRFSKDKKENPNYLISGFVDGKLMYIFEFPFKTKSFSDNLKKQLDKHFPDGDIVSNYLRSARFDYRNFIDSKDLKIIFLESRETLKKFNYAFNKKFFEKILKLKV